jgi:hypothetical protein
VITGRSQIRRGRTRAVVGWHGLAVIGAVVLRTKAALARAGGGGSAHEGALENIAA